MKQNKLVESLLGMPVGASEFAEVYTEGKWAKIGWDQLKKDDAFRLCRADGSVIGDGEGDIGVAAGPATKERGWWMLEYTYMRDQEQSLRIKYAQKLAEMVRLYEGYHPKKLLTTLMRWLMPWAMSIPEATR